MNKKTWIILSAVVVLLGGGGYAGYHYLGSKDAAAEQPQEGPPSFPTAVVDRGDVKKTIFASGTVEAKAREEVKPELAGKVEQVFVKEGQRVNKGDPLFSIDSTDAALELQKQELSIVRAQRELNDLKNRKDRIAFSMGGKVKEVLVKEGDTVTPETVVAKLVDTDHLKITGKFSAFEAEHFKVGQKVKVFISASMIFLDGTVTKVDLIGKKEKGVGGVHDVEVLVKKPGALYVGDLGEVQYVDPNGVLFASQMATPFEDPDVVEVVAGTHGKVGKVEVENGDEVKAGQLLAKMDMSASELDLKEKELALKESLLTLEQKKREIAKKRVTAPISGVITKLEVKPGETPDSGKPAAVIMDSSAVYFVAAVDEIDIPSIRVGQTAEVYVTAFGNKPFTGKVVDVPKEGTKEDKSVRFAVKIELTDAAEMKHGMTGDCDIYVEKKENVLRLPLQAVDVLEDGKGTVMVKDPKTGEPTPKEVEIGIEGSEFIEIKSGIAEGEEVLMMNGGEGM
ncbi:efflux RND transporter periplasmic adaptor subunit [Brevibacillus thermoruber]|jgi:multidrug resistance efflux pump|uniref:efflux RND transporter periplasmic adaptor subunit n=1 Tax=Brevibacillus thermoruber TaxID=33942 RepID=UPI00054E7784|nr:efflux RND transporter periplasmic adaptor subunit [Brevibacillus thermoruber]